MGVQDVREAMQSGRRLPIPSEPQALGLSQLIADCWEAQPNRRPDAQSLISRLRPLVSVESVAVTTRPVSLPLPLPLPLTLSRPPSDATVQSVASVMSPIPATALNPKASVCDAVLRQMHGVLSLTELSAHGMGVSSHAVARFRQDAGPVFDQFRRLVEELFAMDQLGLTEAKSAASLDEHGRDALWYSKYSGPPLPGRSDSVYGDLKT